MSQFDSRVSKELVYDPVLLFSFLPSDGSSDIKPVILGNIRFEQSYFQYTYLGRIGRTGYVRKVSRYLSSFFKLRRLERYAEQVTFQLKDNYIFVRSKCTNKVLNCIEVPLGEHAFLYQMKVFLQVYFNYELFLKRTEKFEEREDRESQKLDLEHVLRLALSVRVDKFSFNNA